MLRFKSFVPALFILSFFSLKGLAQAPKKIKTIIVDAGHGGKDGGAHAEYVGGLGSWEKDITLAISIKLVADLQKALPDVNIVPTRTTDIYQSPPEKADIANANKGDLFICIHADAVELKQGRRQIGTRYEIKHTVYYIGKGKKRKKMIKSKNVVVPIYEYYKIGTPRKGTSIWIFAAHKTSAKLAAIMKNDTSEIELGSGEDSTLNDIDFNSTENRLRAQVYAKRYQERSIKLAALVDDEISETDRPALGINQRQKGIWVLQATNMPAILVETGFIDNYDDERYLNSDAGQQEIADRITAAVVRYKAQMENAGHPTATQATTDSTATTVPAVR